MGQLMSMNVENQVVVTLFTTWGLSMLHTEVLVWVLTGWWVVAVPLSVVVLLSSSCTSSTSGARAKAAAPYRLRAPANAEAEPKEFAGVFKGLLRARDACLRGRRLDDMEAGTKLDVAVNGDQAERAGKLGRAKRAARGTSLLRAQRAP